MIVDNPANDAEYFSLHPLVEKAFEYISQHDMEKAGTGITVSSAEDNHVPLIGEGSTKRSTLKGALI